MLTPAQENELKKLMDRQRKALKANHHATASSICDDVLKILSHSVFESQAAPQTPKEPDIFN